MAKKKSPPTSAAAKAPSRCNWLLFSMDSCDVYRVRAVDYRARRRRRFRLGLRRRCEGGSRRPGHLAIEVEIRGRRPVISLEPRLKVRSWIAHFTKTTTRLWNWTRYMMWMSDQTSHAGSPAR